MTTSQPRTAASSTRPGRKRSGDMLLSRRSHALRTKLHLRGARSRVSQRSSNELKTRVLLLRPPLPPPPPPLHLSSDSFQSTPDSSDPKASVLYGRVGSMFPNLPNESKRVPTCEL
mmetsp:Transcript_38201/g.86636  ORF Transcript_38201/g.86636 Transcript_38201/m.86636 type:complete len:116 (+) Transcript_38201:394-741(+)